MRYTGAKAEEAADRMKLVRQVAILGAGTMGARIAAQFANAGIPSLLLDLTAKQAQAGLEAAKKASPPALFTANAAGLIETGDFESGLPRIGGCDWVIEAVTENLEIKRALWQRVLEHAGESAVLSTNTSGIPLRLLAEGWPETAARRFLGTHFFTPPRYLHLLEVIPGPTTDPVLLEAVAAFCDRRLGKGIVVCKDTPNFVGNRIGAFWGATVEKLTIEMELGVEQVDAITGPLIGLPKSASFRLLDVVGLDVWQFVARNLYELVPQDPWRERFRPAPFFDEMVRRGWLGDKAGQGFYRKQGKGANREIWALDWKTLEYKPPGKPKLPELEAAKLVEDLPNRLRAMVAGDGPVARFLWRLYADVFTYAAERIPEIADRPVEIDRAMRWGYGHALGPFEIWDTLGFTAVCGRMEKEGRALPELVARMRERNAVGWYRPSDERLRPRTDYFDLVAGHFRAVEPRPGIIRLSELKRCGGLVESNPGVSLVDLDDGVACLEFHSKMNTLGEDTIRMIDRGLARLESDFEALVIANEGEVFSAGANLMLILMAARDGEWEELNLMGHRLQQAFQSLKYAPKPVVAAPFSRALGGGCEVVLHARGVQASAELYMGLVEVGVGVIPAAGGCKEMIIRLKDPRRVFEVVGMAKVSSSAAEAKELGLLDKSAGITMNPERLLHDAKSLALALTASWQPGAPRSDVQVGGRAAFAALKQGAWMMREAGYISDHDFLIAQKLAHVLTDAGVAGSHLVSEQHLLDLEREAFLSLCGTAETQARMEHMLKTGKPLRN